MTTQTQILSDNTYGFTIKIAKSTDTSETRVRKVILSDLSPCPDMGTCTGFTIRLLIIADAAGSASLIWEGGNIDGSEDVILTTLGSGPFLYPTEYGEFINNATNPTGNLVLTGSSRYTVMIYGRKTYG